MWGLHQLEHCLGLNLVVRVVVRDRKITFDQNIVLPDLPLQLLPERISRAPSGFRFDLIASLDRNLPLVVHGPRRRIVIRAAIDLRELSVEEIIF